MTRLFVALALVATLLRGATASSAAPARPGPAAIHGTGTWLNTAPLTLIAGPDAAGVYVGAGPSTWSGPLLAGTTVYTATFTIDADTGDIAGTIAETFTGSAANGARGTIRFAETISVAGSTGAVVIVAAAVAGTGDFCHVAGRLVFTGTSDPTGVGGGPYTGRIVTPQDCP